MTDDVPDRKDKGNQHNGQNKNACKVHPRFPPLKGKRSAQSRSRNQARPSRIPAQCTRKATSQAIAHCTITVSAAIRALPISRRTVAKYREMLNIPVARLRKQI